MLIQPPNPLMVTGIRGLLYAPAAPAVITPAELATAIGTALFEQCNRPGYVVPPTVDHLDRVTAQRYGFPADGFGGGDTHVADDGSEWRYGMTSWHRRPNDQEN